MTRLRFTILAVSLGLAAPVAAEVKPHAIFDNHMVLQRNSPLPIWGIAEPGEEIYVHLEIKTPDGKREEGQAVKADKDGNWMARLAAFPAGTDGTLTIRGEDKKPMPKEKKAPNAVVFKDVAVGEVWVCSGQSNMEMSLAGCSKGGGPEAIKNSANPNLRVFTVPKFARPTPKKASTRNRQTISSRTGCRASRTTRRCSRPSPTGWPRFAEGGSTFRSA